MKKRKLSSGYSSPTWTGRIGYDGEALVASLLPKSRHLNRNRDRRLEWDVVWLGIRMDVKTTANKRSIPQFSGYDTEIDLLFVYVDKSFMDDLHFWVRHSSEGFKRHQILSQSIQAKDLAQAIIDCHNKYSKIYKKTVDKQLSML